MKLSAISSTPPTDISRCGELCKAILKRMEARRCKCHSLDVFLDNTLSLCKFAEKEKLYIDTKTEGYSKTKVQIFCQVSRIAFGIAHGNDLLRGLFYLIQTVKLN